MGCFRKGALVIAYSSKIRYFQKYLQILFTLLTLIILTSGCVSNYTARLLAMVHDDDVSIKEEMWGDFELGDTFNLKKDVFLVDDNDWGVALPLVPPGDLSPIGGMEFAAPRSISAYQENPILWPEVRGVIQGDTHLQIVGFRHYYVVDSPGIVYPLAQIKSGVHSDTFVNLYDLTLRKSEGAAGGPELRKPESRLLSFVGHANEDEIVPEFEDDDHISKTALKFKNNDSDSTYSCKLPLE